MIRPAWVTRGIEQLIRQFCARPSTTAWIGSASIDPFAGRPTVPRLMVLRDGSHYDLFPNIPLAEGFVCFPQPGMADPELWLAPTKTDYRNVYEKFAQRYLGSAGLAGADVQIDHVFPKKAGVLGGLAYVRMLAIPPESNMAAGRTLERAMVARNEELGGRGKPVRMATYFAIGKATGFVGYEQMPDNEESAPNAALAALLMAHLRQFGLPSDVLTALDQKLTADRAASLR
jgi:hypothetical protein